MRRILLFLFSDVHARLIGIGGQKQCRVNRPGNLQMHFVVFRLIDLSDFSSDQLGLKFFYEMISCDTVKCHWNSSFN